MESFRGKLLLATPELLDSNFFRAVILVLEHTNEGAIGVVLNRPSDLYSVDVLPKWNLDEDSHSLLHWGCLLYTSPSPRDKRQSRMPSSA